jgi:hypothetical protein
MIQAIIGLALFIAGVTGYILNIVSICQTAGFTGMLVARVIGVFAFPLGIILGFF